MSKYAQVAPNAFKKLAMNAGVFATGFVPATGVVSGILAATSGGIKVDAVPEYVDFGEDIDNVRKNTKELKRIKSWAVTASMSLASIDTTSGKSILAAADIDPSDATHIVPRHALKDGDFNDMWVIGDYSDVTDAANGGYVAIRIKNALSTGGLSLQTADAEKGKFSVTYTGHYSLNDGDDDVPFDVYIKAGLPNMTVVSAAGTSSGKTKLTVSGYTLSGGESYVYKTAASVAVPQAGDTLTAWTSWDGSAEITATSGNDIVVAVVDSNTKAVAGGKATVVSAA